MSYAPWVDKIYDQDVNARLRELNRVLNSFAGLSRLSEKLGEALADLKEFEKPSFLTHLHTVPMKGGAPGKVKHLKFTSPVVAVKHKTLPLVLAVGKNKSVMSSGPEVSFDKVDSDFEIRQCLSWVDVVSRMNLSEKKNLANLILAGLVAQRKGKRSDEVWLSDFIAKGREFKIVGFAANAPYINVDRKWGDTKPIWVHPWGIPALLLKHKTLPIIMMVSPAIRLNENMLGDKSMEGYTG